MELLLTVGLGDTASSDAVMLLDSDVDLPGHSAAGGVEPEAGSRVRVMCKVASSVARAWLLRPVLA